MSTLNIYTKIVAFDDTNQTNAPKLQAINWTRDTLQGIPVESPSNNEYFIPALGSKTIFDGTRALDMDNTTQFSVALSSLSSTRYRLTWSGGEDPVFRTARSLSVSGGSITFQIKSNQTALVTHSAGSVFSNIVVGDEIFIPGVTTGDTSVFNTLNEGKWLVLAASSTQLTLVRETGEVFTGWSETVSISSNSQFYAYSSDGVQVDDVVRLISGFSSALLHSYEILTVTSKFIEFESMAPLPSETVVPGVGGVVIFESAKRWLYLETNQEVELVINSETVPPITPFLAGDDWKVGPYMTTSIVYSLVINNKSTQQARVRIIAVE